MSRGRGTRSRSRGDGWDGWGGYMNAKRQKLQEQFEDDTPGQLQKEGSSSKIFNGIKIHVDGYTKPSSDELKRLMMLHGGGYEHYLYRTRVTHVIATNLPNSKVKELRGLKVVRPEWITESIAAGKLLPYTRYLLYTAQSGLQKGLQSYSVSRENSNQSEENLQSINSNMSETAASVSLAENDLSMESLEEQDEDENNGKPKKQPPLPSFKNKSVTSASVSPAKAGDPKFLSEFYGHSRLHYLSTWKAEWKNYVNELQTKGGNFPGRDRLRKVVQERGEYSDVGLNTGGKLKRTVMHIDMDCFFVSVGLRKRPDLKGKPVAVTHSRGKGATPDPESDLNFEQHQTELKHLQGGKKAKKRTKDSTPVSDDLSFPDESDSGSEDNDVTDDVISVTKTTKESFHSMAEIASCSYEARQAGVRNGMFMGKAKSICPELVTIPYDFEGYKAVSKILYDTVASYTHDIEAVSCDEMLVDCTDLLADTGATPLEFATLLRAELFEKTDCPASAGIGGNILLARMANRHAKPNGQFHLTEDLVSGYIKTQPVKDIPGVGWSLSKRLDSMKVVTCGDLQRHSLESLQKEFGAKTGQSLYRYCRGQDDRPIKIEQQRKSVSAEVNYGIRFSSDLEAVRFMEELSEEVCNRLKSIKMKGKTLTLKIMVRREDAPRQTSKLMGHGICNNISKSVTLPLATDDPKIVARETINLLKQQRVQADDLRGIGIQVQKLETAELGPQKGSKSLSSILSYTVSPAAGNHDNQTSSVISNKQSSVISNKQSPNTTSLSAVKSTKSSESFRTILDKVDSDSTKEKISSMETDEADEVTDLTHLTETTESCKLGKVPYINSNLTTVTDNELDKSERLKGSKDFEGVIASQMNLVEELGRRQTSGTALPPLPCLPDIKTPDSGKKYRTSISHITESSDAKDLDYFPSPSQVDPAVLQELPDEIRQQIEQELQLRRKSTARTVLAAPGCSHWQAQEGGNSAEEHSHDAIVALPSPSQIDPSCLEALPDFLQAELKQAYSKRGASVGPPKSLPVGGVTTLQLKQAQTSRKSPSKRSPGKGSPNFKVPQGRPSGRGRKKGSSKKILFKDQTRTRSQTSALTVSVDPTVENNSTDNIKSDVPSNRAIGETRNQSISHDDRPVEPVMVEETVTCVNLCGATELHDVRLLLQEWITSTSNPQPDDEEVLVTYLHDLILDRNLEFVDLILKFMFRSINRLKSDPWLMSLKKIFRSTQHVVFELYNSRLASINV